MRPWIEEWLNGWRGESLVMISPLREPIARQRLAAALTSYRRAPIGHDGYRISGRIDTSRPDYSLVSAQAARTRSRNSWRPVFHGRLEPAGSGSRLIGTLGWQPLVKTFSIVWFGMAGFFCVIGLPIAVARAATGDFHGAFIGLPAFALPVSFVGITLYAERLGRPEATYLRSWLADRLESAGPV